MSNALSKVRKVPLDHQGIQSAAYSVQLDDGTDWNEVGVVSNNYLLVPNEDVVDLAETITLQSDFEWKENKTFFNGKRFMKSYITEDCKKEFVKGDDIALGMVFWNSYDGSKALSFSMFLARLVCMNGMMSNDIFSTYKFKHDISSDGYEDEIMKATSIVNHRGEENLDLFLDKCRNLTNDLDIDKIGQIRHEYLKDLPTGVFGKIMDKYLLEKDSDSGWEFLNACTNVLWHNDKTTTADFKNNAICVDGMLNYASN